MKSFSLVLIILAIIAVGTFAYFISPRGTITDIETGAVKRFSGEPEFKSYLLKSSELSGVGYFGGTITGAALEERALPTMAPAVVKTDGGGEPSRVSTTTVQVAGIDEPDIVKTDGKEIYFSSYGYRAWWGMGTIPFHSGETKLVKAFPPASLKEDAKIDKNGDLLLHNNVLLVFSWDKIYGYDVSNPESPKAKWAIELNGSVIGARLYGDKVYLITRNTIDYYHPCPIIPLSKNGVPIRIECSMIYHPTEYVPVDATYNAFVLNPDSGDAEKTVSFVGSSGSSIIYMSENSIYATYSYYEDYFKMYYNFLKEKGTDLIPSYVMENLGKINEYDISTQSKLTELMIILQRYQSSLSRDDQLKFDNELSNRMKDYFEEHRRDLVKTGIVKIGLNLEVLGVGNVPGTPLNQFSLDEYNGNLRVAMTAGGWGGNTTNDVYVLDGNLKIIGSVLDLGLGERIYSARFIQDKGYIVTFRQIDPFFVLDLSNPTKPELKGQLKIPGYSSYLHPITKDKILGIGKEGQYVKISLFDVTSAENPQEVDHYSLNEYWSEILNNYHAFLLDDKHEIFFLPGGNGGYVFSYKDNKLGLERAVSEISAKRAVYIEDYLYIIGENKIVVLDENNWEKIKEIEF